MTVYLFSNPYGGFFEMLCFQPLLEQIIFMCCLENAMYFVRYVLFVAAVSQWHCCDHKSLEEFVAAFI